MKKNRLIAFIVVAAGWYVCIASAMFVVWNALVWILYTHEENMSRYCVFVSLDQPHDFLIDANDACRIDWGYFIKEPLFLSAFVYAVLIGPVALAGFVLKRRWKI